MRANDEKRIRTMKCTTAIGAGFAVVADTTDATNQTCKLPAGADPTSGVIGVTYRAAVAMDGSGTNYLVDIVVDGSCDVFVKAAGTAIAHGDFVVVHGTTGSGKKGAIGTASMFFGIANEKATVDDVLISIDLQRGLVPAS